MACNCQKPCKKNICCSVCNESKTCEKRCKTCVPQVKEEEPNETQKED